MNNNSYLFLLIFIMILLFYKYSSFFEKKVQNNSFVKPEHNLFHLLSNISLSDKVVLKNIKEKWSLTKQTINAELNEKIVNLEIPTGNPLLIKFGNNLKVQDYKYLDNKRAKKILFNI